MTWKPIGTICFSLLLLVTLFADTVRADEDVDAVMAQFGHEPTVREVQEQAMRYSLISQDQMIDWIGESAHANWLPRKVKVEGYWKQRTHAEDELNDDWSPFDPNYPADLRLDKHETQDVDYTDDYYYVKGSLEWDFSRLIFNADEMKVAKQNSDLVELREDILNAVTKLYFERRRIQIELLVNPPKDRTERIKMELRVQELTADIDAFTGGWFSEQLRAVGDDPYK